MAGLLVGFFVPKINDTFASRLEIHDEGDISDTKPPFFGRQAIFTPASVIAAQHLFGDSNYGATVRYSLQPNRCGDSCLWLPMALCVAAPFEPPASTFKV